MKAVYIVLLAGIVGAIGIQTASAAKAGTYQEKVVYDFCSQQQILVCLDGTDLTSGLIYANGTLYGTTTEGGANACADIPVGGEGCGTIYSINPRTGAHTVLYSFCPDDQSGCPDGAFPYGNLTAVNGVLYGTTEIGGTAGNVITSGTVFSFDPNTGVEKVLYSFCSQQNCADGAAPEAGLIAEKGLLYGTTTMGGLQKCQGYQSECGIVFSIDPGTGAEKVIYSFCSQHAGQQCTDGWSPTSALLAEKGKLYGTTPYGGSGSCGEDTCGTVFSLDLKTGKEKVLHSFTGGSDGVLPAAGLTAANGMLYGTTQFGGNANCGDMYEYGCGTVFAVDPGTGVETVPYAFCSQQHCADGFEPTAGLINVKGKLFGTTFAGGDPGAGTVFSIDPDTGHEQVVYSFLSSPFDGWSPRASVVDVGGRLYGTNIMGGEAGGTVFELSK